MAATLEKGAYVYSPFVLKFYDWWVLNISNRFAWQCSTQKVLLPFFERHVGQRHLDVGVGTGFYLSCLDLSPNTQITLLDLNRNSLSTARKRLCAMPHPRPFIRTIQHDITRPLPRHENQQYDTISLFYLLHCLSGNMRDKGCVFVNLKYLLTDNGTLFGATILGDDIRHNRFGRILMFTYNQRGIFGNRTDTEYSLRTALEEHFIEVSVNVIGKVALFTGRKIKSDSNDKGLDVPIATAMRHSGRQRNR